MCNGTLLAVEKILPRAGLYLRTVRSKGQRLTTELLRFCSLIVNCVCVTLNICGIKILWFKKNDIFALILAVLIMAPDTKKICKTFSYFSV